MKPRALRVALAWSRLASVFALALLGLSALSRADDTLRIHQDRIELRSRDSRVQLLVDRSLATGEKVDATRDVQWDVAPAELGKIDATGLIVPQQSGNGTITARSADGASHSIPITVAFPDEEPLINFANQVVPIFTKYGCNGGGCHGKMAGQNGFRLSLLGFEPREDFEHLVRESRGRRLFPASPDASLLLQKSVGTVPHGGGQRMEMDSHEYRILRRWISQAMPYGDENEKKVASIEVIPAASRLQRGASQQLSVIATYVDGQKEDISRTVQYESNNLDMAEVSATGLVQLRDMAGEVSVMARYQGKVAVFRASIPLGTAIDRWPEERNSLDSAVFAKLRALGIPPSEPCDDATFLRRVTLDIAGRLPTLHEIRSSQGAPREQIVDRLLESDDYAYHFAGKWSAILRNRHTGEDTRYGAFAFHDWLVDSFRSNKPYSQFVRELLTASGSPQVDPAVIWYRQVNNTESRIEDAAQLFLGQRMQCARCHHHPYEKWGQQDYFQMAAFFSKVERRDGLSPQEPRFVSRLGDVAAKHPKSGQALPASGLDAPPLQLPPDADPREAFADWMTEKDNPFFAKSVANRYWKHFFGRALIEPEDDLRVTNPPSNPELMDALANELIQSKFDLKHLIRTICNSSTYQLSENANAENLRDSNCYSRYYPKRLPAELLLDAIDDVTASRSGFEGMPAGTRAIQLPDTSFQSYFLTVFGRPESATSCECERTTASNLAQSLHLMNSKEMHTKLSAAGNRLSIWSEIPPPNEAKSPAEVIREKGLANISELYLLALSREPTPSEQTAALEYLLGRQDRLREAYEDLTWSVLNSKEFLFNH
ncbi:Bacterial Ig-like domain (group 2) [Pirellula sp. SH-Sr6A]|uniref:DUF1553 domain-containing protein n=1 Tax=Pirellula sp. SH-Sr6A TaxID=1632865 RepID=UPI00078E4852|nr:DUF1553 domain-containing protein [Pirellula sp. SH-Sr6A]AMV34229.1 Bacterial Ig-like domain (group 2) [Pirellula sp. SH-Sr6A]